MAKASPAMVKPKAAAPAKPAAAAKNAAQAKPAAAAEQEKVELVTLRQLADSLGDAHRLSHKQANEVLSSAIASIAGHLRTS